MKKHLNLRTVLKTFKIQFNFKGFNEIQPEWTILKIMDALVILSFIATLLVHHYIPMDILQPGLFVILWGGYVINVYRNYLQFSSKH